MNEQDVKELKKRTLVGSLAIALVAVMVLISQVPMLEPLFSLFIATLVSGALWEYYQLAQMNGYDPKGSAGIFWAVVYILAIHVGMRQPEYAELPAVTMMLGFFTVFSSYLLTGRRPISSLAITVFGFIYVAMTLGCIVNIAYYFPIDGFEDGRAWLLYLIAVTKVADMAAYFVGKNYGKRKLAEHLSPGKTVEGAIGGVVGALSASVLLYLWLNNDAADTPFSLTFNESLRLGLMLGVIGQIGDLAESLLKRDAGVKDSNQLPGLGGLLDMVDSLLFTTPVLYAFLLIR